MRRQQRPRHPRGPARWTPVVLMTTGRYKIKGKRPARPIGFGPDDSGWKEGAHGKYDGIAGRLNAARLPVVMKTIKTSRSGITLITLQTGAFFSFLYFPTGTEVGRRIFIRDDLFFSRLSPVPPAAELYTPSTKTIEFVHTVKELLR